MPTAEVRDKKTGRVAQVTWAEGQPQPTEQELAEKFDQQAQPPQLEPDESWSEFKPGQYSRVVPEQQQLPTAPTSQVTPGEFLKSGGREVNPLNYDYSKLPQGADRTTAQLAIEPTSEELHQEVMRPELELAKTLGSGFISMPGAVSSGVSKIGRGLEQLAGPGLNQPKFKRSIETGDIAGATKQFGVPIGPLGMGFAGEQPDIGDIPPETGGLGKGLLNIGAGTAEGLLGLALGLTPQGSAFSAITSALSKLPGEGSPYSVPPQKIIEFAMHPATDMKAAEFFGIKDPEAAANINTIADVLTQALGVKAMRGAGRMALERPAEPGLQSSVTPGMAPEALNSFISRASRGEEIPFFTTKQGVKFGNPGEPHSESFRQYSHELSKNGPVGRIDEGGRLVAIWGSRSDWSDQQVADALWSIYESGRVKKNAIVYFADGENMKLMDAIAGTELPMSAIPGVPGRAISETVKKIVDATKTNGGATFDPRTGEDRGGKPGVAVSPYPNRSTTIDGPITQGQVQEFISKNSDLLKQEDHYVGTWYDKASNKTYLDVSIIRPRDEAIELAKHPGVNQKAVFDLEKFEEIPTGGTGMSLAGAPEFNYGEYRKSRMTPEQIARETEIQRKRTEEPVWRQSFGEFDRQAQIGQRAIEYMRDELGFEQLPPGRESGLQVQRIIDAMAPDLERVLKIWDEHTQQTGEARKPWYGGWSEAKTILSKYYPELKDPVQAKLMGWMMNIFGNGASPNVEFLNGLSAWEQYRKSGTMGLPDEMFGGVRDMTLSRQLKMLENLTKKLGVKGATEWLEQKHDPREIAKMKTELRVSEAKSEATVLPEYGVGQKIEGAYIFGPKLGAYGLNKEGVSGPVTMDKWMNIAHRLVMGNMRTEIVPETGKEQLFGGNTVGERRIGREAITQLSKKFGLTPEDAQALEWVYIIRPFFERHGQRLLEGGSHGDFARWLDESGWLAKRVRGEGGSLAEGREITESEGFRQRTQTGPEQLRAKPEGGAGETDFEFGANKPKPKSPTGGRDAEVDHILSDPFFVATAIKYGDKIWRGDKGQIHIEVAEKMLDDLGYKNLTTEARRVLNDRVDGFIDRDGNFHTREEAAKIAKTSIGESMTMRHAGALKEKPKGETAKMSVIPGAPEPGTGEGAWERLSKYAGSINVNKMNIDEDAKNKLKSDFETIRKPLEDILGKKLTDAEVLEAAKESDVFKEVFNEEQQRQIAAMVLRLRQSVAGGAGEARPTKQYYEDFLRLQATSKFFGRMLQKFNIEAEPVSRPGMAGALSGNLNEVRMRVLDRLGKLDLNMQDVVARAQSVNWSDAGDVTRFYREFVKPTTSELIDEFRYINLLSSPRTHVINAFSNILQVSGLAPATKAVSGFTDMVASTLSGKERQHYVRETPAYFKGALNSTPKAAKAAMDVISGRSAMERFDVNNIPSAGEAASRAMIPIAKFNQVFAGVGRALEASDVFFRTIAQGGELAARLEKSRIKGGPVDLSRLSEEAMRAAEYWVFRKPLDIENKTKQGALLTNIDKFTHRVYQFRRAPGVKWFLPFVATPMNILKQGIEYSPAGFVTMMKNGDKVEAFSKAMIGSSVLAGAAGIVANTETTWGIPQNPGDRADFEAAGRIPYAIKIGGEWYSYSKLGPIAYPIALAAAYKFYATDEKAKSRTEMEQITQTMSGYAKFFSDQSYVQGLASIADALQGDVRMTESAALNTGRQMIPLNAMANWINGIVDGTRRAPDNIFERFEVNLPGLSQNVTPRVTPLGTEQQKPGFGENLLNLSPVAIAGGTDDELAKKLDQMGLSVGLPAKTVYEEKLDEPRYQEYVKEIGAAVRQELSGVPDDPEFQKLPKQDQQDYIDSVVRRVRKQVREGMFDELRQKAGEGDEE